MTSLVCCGVDEAKHENLGPDRRFESVPRRVSIGVSRGPTAMVMAEFGDLFSSNEHDGARIRTYAAGADRSASPSHDALDTVSTVSRTNKMRNVIQNAREH